MKKNLLKLLMLLALFLVYSCTEEEAPKATSLELISGDDQVAFTSTQLTDSIVFFVSDQYGNAYEGALIEFFPESGFVNKTKIESDGDGSASVNWTLGDMSGEQTLTVLAVDDGESALKGAPLRVKATAFIDTLATIVFVVSDSDIKLQDATVYINGMALRPTDERGMTDTALVAGNYAYSIEAEGYDVKTSGFYVYMNQDQYFTQKLDKLYGLICHVTDELGPVSNAQVTINSIPLSLTDENGETDTTFVFGRYYYQVEAEGYVDIGPIVFNVNEDLELDIKLEKKKRTQFYVNDGNLPIEGALVKLNGKALGLTDENGQTDTILISGQYYYEVEADGYAGTGSTVFNVNDDIELDIKLEKKRNVRFYVSDGSLPIEGALVTTNGNDLELTGDDGYTETLLTKGEYSYTIEREGYVYNGELDFEISDSDQEIQVIMDELFEVSFVVIADGELVSYSEIEIVDVAALQTSANGEASVSLISGEYRCIVKAQYFLDSEENIFVVKGQDENVDIELAYLSSMSVLTPPSETVLPINAILSEEGMVVELVWSNGFTESVSDDEFDQKGLIVPTTNKMGNETTVLQLSHQISDLVLEQTYTNALVTDIDNNVYLTTKIGDQIWMVGDLRTRHYPNGLSIPKRAIASWPSLVDDNVSDAYAVTNAYQSVHRSYGIIYSYSAAIADNWAKDNSAGQGICPDGWHLPQSQEWEDLKQYVTGDGFSGNLGSAMKAVDGWTEYNGVDYYGFSAQPNQRFYSIEAGSPIEIQNTWWMAFDDEKAPEGLSEDRALVISLFDTKRGFAEEWDLPKGNGLSVRCVKND